MTQDMHANTSRAVHMYSNKRYMQVFGPRHNPIFSRMSGKDGEAMLDAA
jgi:hypothetical protein